MAVASSWSFLASFQLQPSLSCAREQAMAQGWCKAGVRGGSAGQPRQLRAGLPPPPSLLTPVTGTDTGSAFTSPAPVAIKGLMT